MTERKLRIETDNAPASTGFRSQGLVAGGIFFGAGQIGAEMPEPGVLREPAAAMADAVNVTLGHLDQVTQAAGLSRANVFEVSAFPKVTGNREVIHGEIVNFLGFEPQLFTYHEVYDVAMHALIEMDWMAVADASVTQQQAADWLRPLGHGEAGEAIYSGPFVMWNKLAGEGKDLSEASHALLADLKNRLEAQGGSLDDLVKLTIYLYEFDPYPQFNEATKQYFADIIPPARSVLVAPAVTGNAKVVIDVLALKPAGK
jgi:enamine deaminase RidA (YjgF/YER057c/UK114 family)